MYMLYWNYTLSVCNFFSLWLHFGGGSPTYYYSSIVFSWIIFIKHSPFGKDTPIQPYWQEYEQIMSNLGGRPHWAKVRKYFWFHSFSFWNSPMFHALYIYLVLFFDTWRFASYISSIWWFSVCTKSIRSWKSLH